MTIISSFKFKLNIEKLNEIPTTSDFVFVNNIKCYNKLYEFNSLILSSPITLNDHLNILDNNKSGLLEYNVMKIINLDDYKHFNLLHQHYNTFENNKIHGLVSTINTKINNTLMDDDRKCCIPKVNTIIELLYNDKLEMYNIYETLPEDSKLNFADNDNEAANIIYNNNTIRCKGSYKKNITKVSLSTVELLKIFNVVALDINDVRFLIYTFYNDAGLKEAYYEMYYKYGNITDKHLITENLFKEAQEIFENIIELHIKLYGVVELDLYKRDIPSNYSIIHIKNFGIDDPFVCNKDILNLDLKQFKY